MSGYRTFAGFYDRLTGDVDYSARADYLLSLFALHRKKPALLLDLACGSGSLSVELLRRGVDIIGVDGAAEMLLTAREKAAAMGFSPLFLQQDMRQLDLYGTVDGCVCVLDSLNHLTATADVLAVFRRLSLFVEPDGLLIFDVNTPYKHRTVLGDNAFVTEEEGLVCVWRNCLQEKTGIVTEYLDFFEEQPDGSYQRYSDEVRERAYATATLERLLRQAAFEPLAVYADGTTEAPGATCQRVVFVAQNRTTRYQEQG